MQSIRVCAVPIHRGNIPWYGGEGPKMRKLALGLATILIAWAGAASAVEYVKICTLYGDAFFYVPGTDTCFNPVNGDMRRQTEFGTLRRASELAQRLGLSESAVVALAKQMSALGGDLASLPGGLA